MARGLGSAAAIQPALWQYQMGLYAQMLDARVRAVPAPAEAEVAAYHRSRAGLFAHPAKRECAHILFESRGEAVQAQRKIARGARFEEVARAESLDKGSGQKGGHLGEIGEDWMASMAQVPGQGELAQALRSVPAGQVSEPVQSPQGFHLLRCGPRRPPVDPWFSGPKGNDSGPLSEANIATVFPARPCLSRASRIIPKAASI